MDDFWAKVVAVTRRALELGALEPIATERIIVEEGDIPFIVHLLARLERKQRARWEQERSGVDPFLPPDPHLLVAEVSDSHLCVLNRFNVFDHHLLIVTRRFEDQLSLLNLADFEALATCMVEMEGLAFYNAGAVAGASQDHKHLQLVSLPLGAGLRPTPMDVVLGQLDASEGITSSQDLPFPHAVLRRDGAPVAAATAPELLDRYRELLAAVGIDGPGRPYNLLLTRDWMLVVPRRAEHFEGMSVNGLGFAGSLLVRDPEQLELVRRRGPLAALAAVAG